jgi:hypothetical protein
MKEFISKWSNWWILAPKRKQLDDAFEKELNELIEREVALRTHDVVGRSELLVCNCQGCGEVKKIEYCEKCYAENLPDIAN